MRTNGRQGALLARLFGGTTIAGGVVGLLLVFTTPEGLYSQTKGGCQDQVCQWSSGNSCYICTATIGQGCKVESCSSCTNSACGGGSPMGLKLFQNQGEFQPASLTCQQLPADQLPVPTSGTALRLPKQDSSPANILVINHGTTDLFVAGKIKNLSEKKIVAYRVGWVIAYRSGKTSVMQGVMMNVPAGIAPQEIAAVPSQAISGEYLKRDVQTIDFYVSEVQFEGGGGWKEDLRRFEKKRSSPSPIQA